MKKKILILGGLTALPFLIIGVTLLILIGASLLILTFIFIHNSLSLPPDYGRIEKFTEIQLPKALEVFKTEHYIFIGEDTYYHLAFNASACEDIENQVNSKVEKGKWKQTTEGIYEFTLEGEDFTARAKFKNPSIKADMCEFEFNKI
jgi:hypothetical protein